MEVSKLSYFILKRVNLWKDPGKQERLPADRTAVKAAAEAPRAGVIARAPVDKTARMIVHLENHTRAARRAGQRTRLLMFTWMVRSKVRENLKHAFDLALCALVLPLTLPVMLMTALAVKLDSPGPVLFKQERVGKRGRSFLCLKFRSMHVDAEQRKAELMAQNEADEVVFKIKRDPRVTRVGRVIRKLSLDELPQLFNVIRGDMSLVGPRPPLPHEVDLYEYDACRRLEALPGLTGLQQVSGRSELAFKRWVELDLQYIQEQSLLKDILILLKTIPVVIMGKGAY